MRERGGETRKGGREGVREKRIVAKGHRRESACHDAGSMRLYGT